MERILPEALYAEVAPLPVPMAQHLYSTFLKSLDPSLDDPSFFLETFQEKRRSVYAYMDSFVRNRDGQLPHHLRYTTQWLRENLGQYAPDKQPIPPKTLTIGSKMASSATPERDNQPLIVELPSTLCA